MKYLETELEILACENLTLKLQSLYLITITILQSLNIIKYVTQTLETQISNYHLIETVLSINISIMFC